MERTCETAVGQTRVHGYLPWLWGPSLRSPARAGLPRRVRSGVLELESTKGVEEAVWLLQVHVVTCGARLAVTALEEEDFLSHACRDGGGEATLPG